MSRESQFYSSDDEQFSVPIPPFSGKSKAAKGISVHSELIVKVSYEKIGIYFSG